MKKCILLLLPMLLLQACASDGKKPSCFWKRITMQECTAGKLFSMDKNAVNQTLKDSTQAEAVRDLQAETPMVSESTLYSYRLIGNIRELRAQQDKKTLYLFFHENELLDSAQNAVEKQDVYTRFDIAQNNGDDLRLKNKYGYVITLSALKDALGTPDENIYYISPAYEAPIYRLSYGQTDYFLHEGNVVAQTSSPQQREAFLSKISAKDPLDEEIIVHQPAHDPAYPSVSLWDKKATQLSKLFKNKNRQFVLYSAENISSSDGVVRGNKGAEYAFVQYGSNDGNYRKFIFQAENPQTFVAAAANVQDVLAVNKKYGVNLGLSKQEFLKNYEGQTIQTNVTDEVDRKEREIYQVSYTDINTKTPQDRWFMFEEEELVFTFETRISFDNYLNKLGKKNRAARLVAQEKQKAEEARQKQLKAEQTAQQAAARKPYTAIVSGGTEWDRSYRPIVAKPIDGKIIQPQMIK